MPLQTKNGKRREVEFVSNVYEEGNQQVIQCNIRDITERKRIENERDRFFALSMDMLCIANLDGFFQQVNPAFERSLGYSEEDFLFKPIPNFLHPDDQSALMAEYARLATGRPTNNLENRWRCKDGSHKWVAWSYFPVVEEGIAYGVGRDISERKAAEETLERVAEAVRGSELRYRRLFESARDGILILDNADRRITDANPYMTELLGYTLDEFLGKDSGKSVC